MNRLNCCFLIAASSFLALAACGDEEDSASDAGATDTMADMGGGDMAMGDMGTDMGTDMAMGDMGGGDMAMGDMGTDMGGTTAIEGTEGATVNGTFFVSYELNEAAPGVGDTFGMTVSVFESDETTLVADAELALTETMPTMGHGMDTEPTITANGDGTFAVAELAYSMEGLWHYDFTVTSGDRTDMIAFATTCCE